MAGLLDDLDKRRGQVEITNENRARLAQAYGSASTTGQGTIQLPDVIDFNTAFIEKPYVSYCAVVDPDALADAFGLDDPDIVPMPNCSGFVVHWDQDERDFYVGAWVAVKVVFDYYDLVAIDALPPVEHHFTFAAVAMKDIPVDLADYAVD
jgi:hypothetical protein